MAETMRALAKVERAPGLRLIEAPIPQIGPNEVLLQTLASSICGTDVHIYNWDAWSQSRINPPVILGHEFSAITAHRLGARVGVVTSAAEVDDLHRVLDGIEVAVVPTTRTTTFENRYHGNQRVQLLHHAAPPLTFDTIPAAWRDATIVHLAPIARDVDLSLLQQFPNALLTVTPQGWMRRRDERGQVQYQPLLSPSDTLRTVDAIVFSAEDVANDWEAIKALIDAVPLAVVTQAAEGAVVYNQDGAHPMPVRSATLVDPTGAGDVFAAAFFLKLYESGHPLEAAAFANVVASFSIEAPGISGIPSRDAVETWLRTHQAGA